MPIIKPEMAREITYTAADKRRDLEEAKAMDAFIEMATYCVGPLDDGSYVRIPWPQDCMRLMRLMTRSETRKPEAKKPEVQEKPAVGIAEARAAVIHHVGEAWKKNRTIGNKGVCDKTWQDFPRAVVLGALYDLEQDGLVGSQLQLTEKCLKRLGWV
jgi:hypothetical protein